MGLLEDGFKGLGPSLLFSVGAVVAAPIVIPAVMGGLRPLAKTAIKGFLFLSDSLKESMAEAGEQISDLVAETRAEAETSGNGTTARRAATGDETTASESRRSRRKSK